MAPDGLWAESGPLKDASGALLLSSCWNSCVPIYDKNLRTHRLHFAEKVEFENWAQVYQSGTGDTVDQADHT